MRRDTDSVLRPSARRSGDTVLTPERYTSMPLLQLRSQILNSIPSPVLSLDSAWRLSYLNPCAQELGEFAGSEAVGKDLWEVWPELARTLLIGGFSKAMNGEWALEAEVVIGGVRRWFNVHRIPLEDEFLLLFCETSGVYRLLRSLRRSQRSYQRLFNAAPVGVAVVIEGRVAEMNHAGAHLLGVADPASLVGVPLHELLRRHGPGSAPWESHSPRPRGATTAALGTLIRQDGATEKARMVVADGVYRNRRAMQLLFWIEQGRADAAFMAGRRTEASQHPPEAVPSGGQYPGQASP